MEYLTGFHQNKLFLKALQDAWFSNKHDLSVKFSKYFKLISLVTIALIATTVSG